MIWYLLFGALMITVLAIIIFGDKSSKYNLDVSRITIEEVKQDVFQDYITVQGTVEPITTIFLDAVEGGRVDDIFIEEGNIVKKGDVILKLTNDNLLLEITNNEAQVVRAINELRTARLQMDQTCVGEPGANEGLLEGVDCTEEGLVCAEQITDADVERIKARVAEWVLQASRERLTGRDGEGKLP